MNDFGYLAFFSGPAGRLAPAAHACHNESVPKLPKKWRPRPLPAPDLAESEALAHLGRRTDDPPTEAEQALALVVPKAVNPDTGLARPWEPQPNEGAAEYAAFSAYLLADTPTPNHPIARRFAWEPRKVAFKACGAEASLASPAVLAELSGRCVQLALLGCFSELSKHLLAMQSNPQPSLSFAEATRVAKDAAMLARLLGGQSTANVSIKGGLEIAPDYSKLTEEQFTQLLALESLAK